MQQKKGARTRAQAALEFLTTYGWAFMVILIMISALAYFGILNPKKILPDRCTFPPEFRCNDYQTSASASTVKIQMKNNVGNPIIITKFAVGSESATSLTCTVPAANIGDSNPWGSNEVRDFTLSGCDYAAAGLQKDSKEKILVNLSYYNVKSGSNYMHDVKGEIFSSII